MSFVAFQSWTSNGLIHTVSLYTDLEQLLDQPLGPHTLTHALDPAFAHAAGPQSLWQVSGLAPMLTKFWKFPSFVPSPWIETDPGALLHWKVHLGSHSTASTPGHRSLVASVVGFLLACPIGCIKVNELDLVSFGKLFPFPRTEDGEVLVFLHISGVSASRWILWLY